MTNNQYYILIAVMVVWALLSVPLAVFVGKRLRGKI